MRPFSALILLVLSPGNAHLQESHVDEIIRAHLEARGGVEAIRAIETLVYRDGTYAEGDYVNPGGAFMAYKRPHYRLVGNPERPGGFMEGYDGSTWEWYADPGVVVRTVGAASAAIRRGAVFEGPFLGYRERDESGEVIDVEVTIERSPGTTFYLLTALPLDPSQSTFVYDNPFTDEKVNDVDLFDFNYEFEWIQNTPATAGEGA